MERITRAEGSISSIALTTAAHKTAYCVCTSGISLSVTVVCSFSTLIHICVNTIYALRTSDMVQFYYSYCHNKFHCLCIQNYMCS